MIAVLEQAGDEDGVGLEVHALLERIRREARTLDEQQFEPLAQRPLTALRRGGAGDASADEHEALHSNSLSLQRSGPDSPFPSETRCYKLADMLRPG